MREVARLRNLLSSFVTTLKRRFESCRADLFGANVAIEGKQSETQVGVEQCKNAV